jgi:hypothetical protein
VRQQQQQQQQQHKIGQKSSASSLAKVSSRTMQTRQETIHIRNKKLYVCVCDVTLNLTDIILLIYLLFLTMIYDYLHAILILKYIFVCYFITILLF